jgi:hypothetical protein
VPALPVPARVHAWISVEIRGHARGRALPRRGARLDISGNPCLDINENINRNINGNINENINGNPRLNARRAPECPHGAGEVHLLRSRGSGKRQSRGGGGDWPAPSLLPSTPPLLSPAFCPPHSTLSRAAALPVLKRVSRRDRAPVSRPVLKRVSRPGRTYIRPSLARSRPRPAPCGVAVECPLPAPRALAPVSRPVLRARGSRWRGQGAPGRRAPAEPCFQLSETGVITRKIESKGGRACGDAAAARCRLS